MGGCGGPDRTDFSQFLLWEGVVVLQELIFHSFHFGESDGPDRTNFKQFLIWAGVVVLKELNFNSF